MSISRSLINVISDTPKMIDSENLEFERMEKWGVSKTSLLDQKKGLEKEVAEKNKQIQEINDLLALFV